MVEVSDSSQDGMIVPEKRIMANHSSEPEYYSSLDEK